MHGGRRQAFRELGNAVAGVCHRRLRFLVLAALSAIVVLVLSGPAVAKPKRGGMAHVVDVPGESWSGVVSLDWTSTRNVPGLTEDWELLSTYHFDGQGGLTGFDASS